MDTSGSLRSFQGFHDNTKKSFVFISVIVLQMWCVLQVTHYVWLFNGVITETNMRIQLSLIKPNVRDAQKCKK